jgi:hypothetical protein
MTGGCLEECVLVMLQRKGQQSGLNVSEMPDLWAPGLRPFEWERILADWIKAQTGRVLRRWGQPPRGHEVIAVGWSPRDPERVRHAVIMKYHRPHEAIRANTRAPAPTIVYDPHSSGDGVVKPNAFYWW